VATLTLESSHPQREREAGLREVFPEAHVIGACASDLAAAQAAASAYLASQPDVTAIVCQSDVQAAGVVLEARRRGLAVPGDLSVAGFDGVATPWLDLELTTVVQPLAEKGRATAEAALRRIAGEDVADQRLPVEMRVGGSTGPAPTG
jgi:DNA-binding LacI/PurR family transcriptional regulator